MADTDPIHKTVTDWHQYLSEKGATSLEDLLHPDVVFWSPVLFKPQEGRVLTMMYLEAAAMVFPGGAQPEASEESSVAKTSFHYTKKILDGHHAVLEFETQMGELQVNGIDMITCDDQSLITEFKVMIRPFKAIEVVRDRMMAALG
ncbi:MAG: nuclear transport factor 2 family protein [Acidimicrobiales bacterium]|jgi:hypothetical protein|nr:nuclear transport factor 2 family protein [Acidimicrobiales bacterium]